MIQKAFTYTGIQWYQPFFCRHQYIYQFKKKRRSIKAPALFNKDPASQLTYDQYRKQVFLEIFICK